MKLSILFFIFLLVLSSCGHNKIKLKQKDLLLKDIYKEISFATEEPKWILDIHNFNGFANFGNTIVKSQTSFDKDVEEASKIAKNKIYNKIYLELIDLTEQVLEERSVAEKQNFGIPSEVVNSIMKEVKLDNFRIIEIYFDEKNNLLYVYGILNYDKINNNIDKINNVVDEYFIKKFKFSEEIANYYKKMIKQFFNIFDEEKL